MDERAKEVYQEPALVKHEALVDVTGVAFNGDLYRPE
jgi:predicted membrane protein